MNRVVWALLLAAGLSCCGKSNPPPPAPAPAPTVSRPTTHNSAPPPSAAPQSPQDIANIAQAASNQQEGADSASAPDSSEAALEKIAAMPAAGQLPSGSWVAGTNYRVLSPAQPTDVAPGKVEVQEMFWYGCPRCYALDPAIEKWRQSKPAYVEFHRVPVTWTGLHRAHARLYFTLQALDKLDTLHAKVFDEIHQKSDQLFIAGDEKATRQAQLQFARANGISESDFLAAYDSPGVQNSVRQADDLLRREHIDSVPTFVIDGKYLTDVGMAGSPEKLTRLLDDLTAGEKRR